ncbi:MAG: kynureninase [Actinomycetota bacterium]|nr:kynureninase [Actinomycetota bacterium]
MDFTKFGHAVTRVAAEAADAADVLAPIRDRFVVPPGLYLDGNSLGALPDGVAAAVSGAVTEAWGRDLIASWNSNGWWTLPGRVGNRIGLLIGAGPGQVMCGDSTSVQLFQALVGLARANPGRGVVAVDAGDFPTDRYLTDSVGRLLGLTVERVDPNRFVPDDRTAVVAFSAVNFATGELRDLSGITDAVHAAGGLICWDLAHAAGALPVDLDGIRADAAVGCTYKYLCGGPGSPAYLYVAERHHDALDLPLAGWHGHAEPFAMAEHYRPAPGIERARIGTPPVLSMVATDAALAVWDGVDLGDVRAKSLALTDLAIAFVDTRMVSYGVEVVTPRPHHRRGSQLSLRVANAHELSRALVARGVTGDYRTPDILRLGMAPLYLRYVDVWDAMDILAGVLAEKAHLHPAMAPGDDTVTGDCPGRPSELRVAPGPRLGGLDLSGEANQHVLPSRPGDELHADG